MVDPEGLVPRWMVPGSIIDKAREIVNEVTSKAFSEKELDRLTDLFIEEASVLEAGPLKGVQPKPEHGPAVLTLEQARIIVKILERLQAARKGDCEDLELVNKALRELRKGLETEQVTLVRFVD
jgi:hypothetical protein